MQGEDVESRRVAGEVKWFDPAKGFGFVVADGGGADILLHANVLRNFGQSSVADGARVVITVQATPRGEQAVEVHSIEAPALAGGDPMGPEAGLLPEGQELPPLQPARVKWFDKTKGFGFANVFTSTDDVFIHVEVLRRCGLADLQAGEAIAIRVADGRRGRMAVMVQPWEAAVISD